LYEALYKHGAWLLKLFFKDVDIGLVVYFVFSNIISDYVSLFAIRQCLILAGRRPIIAMIAGPLFGALIIIICNFLFSTLWYATNLGNLGFLGALRLAFSTAITEWGNFFYDPFSYKQSPNFFIIPALTIHLWLPLLALSMLALKFLKWATGKAQWFFEGGQEHPLRIIGYVASLLVFLGSGILSQWSLFSADTYSIPPPPLYLPPPPD
jgi:hypothetical protein